MCKNTRDFVSKKHHLSEIYVKYRASYLADENRQLKIEDRHLKAMRMTEVCRTLKLGALVLRCESCGAIEVLYRSCRNRFCPGCGSANTYQWAEKTLSRLLEVPHHHIVMTLPKEYRHLSQMNGNALHDLLFTCSAIVVRSYFKEKYGCLPGMVSVLHTAGSDLKYHPHVHMVVTRGGKMLKNDRYKVIKGSFLVKNEILAKELKKEFNRKLKFLNKKESLIVPKSIREGRGFNEWIEGLKEKSWIVNIEKPLPDVKQIVNYVGRYTKRACISEYKIEKIEPNIVFRYKDYKNSKRGEKPLESLKTMTPTEFLDSLLQHVPTKRYRMVRYYGLYSSYYIGDIPEGLRSKIEGKALEELEEEGYWGELESMRKYLVANGYRDLLICKSCQGKMMPLGRLNPEGELIEIELDEDTS